MVILSAAITTKGGKPLLCRNFREMSRPKIEGLLTAFPKLANPKNTEKHHTFVETDTVRYVYQPLESIIVLLITTKNSNIVEDLDTLQTASRIVKETVSQIDEDKIKDQAYDIIFAFDELISMGYAENITVDQVKTFTEMDSQTENLQNMIKESKINEAVQRAKSAALEIAKKKREKEKQSGIAKNDNYESSFVPRNNVDTSSVGSQNKIGSFSTYKEQTTNEDQAKKLNTFKLVPKKKQTNTLLQEMVKTGEVEADTPEEEKTETAAPSRPVAVAANQEAVHIKVEEKITAETQHEGGINKLEVKGEMSITISDAKSAAVRVHLDKGYNSAFQPKPHPNLDKKLFTDEAALGPKNAKKGFPVNNTLRVLQYRAQASDGVQLPLNVSVWPNASSSGLSVSVEYELTNTDMDLSNIVITIPLPSDKVSIDSVEQGSTKVDSKNEELIWSIDSIDSSNSSGTLDFTVNSKDENSVLPVNVSFIGTKSLADIAVTSVISTETNQSVKFSQETIVSVHEYVIV